MNKKQGFTLIELLVVVLIIGILAAVALPEYQKAVKKARVMRWAPVVKALANAEEVYFLANGSYTPFSSELDVAWPEGALAGSAMDDGYLRLSDGTVLDLLGTENRIAGGSLAYIVARTKDGVAYYQFLDNSSYPAKRICKGDTALCKSFGGVELAGGWTIP